MKTTRIFSNKYFYSSLLVISGIFLGWLLFHSPAGNKPTSDAEIHDHPIVENTVWTCAMHPQIKMDNPGQCPICGMDLIPLKKSDTEIDDNGIEMSESAMKLAEVQTIMVSKGTASKEVHLYGQIQADERLLLSQAAHFPGRIEQLLINVTGEQVKEGQLIARIYSPELITAQKELLEAVSMKETYPGILEAAREKLRNWKLSGEQIQNIETSGNITSSFNIYANNSGIVISRKVSEGDYVGKGEVLFELADLSKVWAVFDAYESDLPWIKPGQKVKFTTKAIPGKLFEGSISFIDPVINSSTRIARVRADISNQSLQLKPGVFINGIIKSGPGESGNRIIIPQSAVLWTGERSLVYVKIPGTDKPSFKMRDITLGATLKDNYIVNEGLTEGEEIVTNGAFSVDAAAQLNGKPSMMNGHDEMLSSMPGMAHDNPDSKIIDKPVKSLEKLEQEDSFTVSGNCEMCKERIENAAKSVKGVLSAEWDINSKKMHVMFVPGTNSEAIQSAIALSGHDTEKKKADDKTYEGLPDCCKYRN